MVKLDSTNVLSPVLDTLKEKEEDTSGLMMAISNGDVL